MELSVIIVAYNAAEFLPRCLESLERHLADVEHEVCLIDNVSTDGGPAAARARYPSLQIISNPRNLGFSTAMNIGLSRTSGRFVLWLNPDAELVSDGIAELLRVFDAEPGVGVIGPRLFGPDGEVQLSCRSFPSYRTAFFNRQSLMTRLFPGNRFSREYLKTGLDRSLRAEVDWVSGACLLHRRSVSEGLRGLDERFFMYCEDVDFCLRASRSGWKILYHPGLEVRHIGGGSSRCMAVKMIREHHRSMWTYYAKHFPRHPLKDAAVGAAIGGRCGLKMLGERLLR